MQRQSGLLAYFPGRSLEPEGEEFVMVTVWRDMEALRAFAGDDWRASVIPEEERPLLAASDVAHYTVYAECSLDAPAV
jgi:quinol monooxygenase YgiN